MKKNLLFMILLGILVMALAACSPTPGPRYAEIPAGKAFSDGETIYFSHTEVSDPDVAAVLTKMMKSPVLVVPALAKIPDEALAKVYVFKNGIAGSGPLKFQPDVFPNPPGDPAYSPLRKITFVTWVDPSKATELKSAAEIQALVDKGELTLEESNIVVNMPFMTWKDGKR
jgi:hypothetical protein